MCALKKYEESRGISNTFHVRPFGLSFLPNFINFRLPKSIVRVFSRIFQPSADLMHMFPD